MEHYHIVVFFQDAYVQDGKAYLLGEFGNFVEPYPYT